MRAAELLSMYEQIERRHMFPFWARGTARTTTSAS